MMPDKETINAVKRYLEERMPSYLDMLREMVAVNSFTRNAAGVAQLAEVTAAMFTPLGFTAELVPSSETDFGPHLVLSRLGTGAQRVGLISHLDTVFPPAEEVANNFHWREEGARIYGPGTVDIKAGTVLIYMVLDALRHVSPTVFAATDWIVLLDASEEVDGEEFAALCRRWLPRPESRAALIFEGGNVEEDVAHVVVARKGMAVFRLSVEGRAAHAGSSHKDGANAIVQMAHLVQQIATYTDYDRALTFNVGTIRGGSVVNRVPHRATATVEMRAFDREVFAQGIAKMMALQEQSTVRNARDTYACKVSIEILRRSEPWPRNGATDRLLALWEDAGRSMGMRVVAEARGGLSDGNYFWMDIATLDGLGPSGGNAHCSERSADGTKDQEYVRRDTFVDKATLNSLAILRLLQA
jgi:glutamate carboxypeptidase